MAKKKDNGKVGKGKMLTEAKVTAKAPKKAVKKSVTSYGEVPTSKIDSARRANPQFNKAIGRPMKGSGGMDTYGRDQSDIIRKAVKK